MANERTRILRRVHIVPATCLCLVAILSVGCKRSEDPAVQAFQQVVHALRIGDAQLFWRNLAPASQRALAEQVDLAPVGAGNTIDEHAVIGRLLLRPGWELEFDLLVKPRRDPNQTTPDRCVLLVRADRREWRIPMVRIDTGWRMDL